MEITKIVSMVNKRMNYEDFSYDELEIALNAAIDHLNTEWRLKLPMITEQTEMVQDKTTVQPHLVPAKYDNLPDDFIRLYVVPYVAAYQYTINEQDARPEFLEWTANFGKLSERYQVNTKPGDTKIVDPNFHILQEDTTDQIGDGNGNYDEVVGVEVGDKLINPLNQ